MRRRSGCGGGATLLLSFSWMVDVDEQNSRPRPDPNERASLDAAVDDFLSRVLGPGAAPQNPDMLRRLLRTVARIARDEPDRLDLKLMTRALREMASGFATFAPYRERRKIAIFGSARLREGTDSYTMTVECARALVEAGYMVVTGAGPGIMEAANRGAGRENSFGVNIELPFEQSANSYIAGDRKLATFKYFFTRKLTFVKETDGAILFPGGFGTMDEGFEALTLIQTGKSVPAPIVMIEPPESNYWYEWNDFVQRGLLAQNLISKDDVNLYRIVHDVRSAVELIQHFYANFHSLRYFGDDLVIRLLVEPSDELLDALNVDFPDILKSGRIERAGLVAGERGGDHFHGLKMHFDQRRFGRLRVLIDRLNDAVADLDVQTMPRLPAVHVVTPFDETEPDDR